MKRDMRTAAEIRQGIVDAWRRLRVEELDVGRRMQDEMEKLYGQYAYFLKGNMTMAAKCSIIRGRPDGFVFIKNLDTLKERWIHITDLT